jgi:hypothetical protein
MKLNETHYLFEMSSYVDRLETTYDGIQPFTSRIGSEINRCRKYLKIVITKI